eukprot:468145-Prymnesium_polylepis.1
MNEAAPAAVLCLASHGACSRYRCAPRAEEAKIFAGPHTCQARHGGLKSRVKLRALRVPSSSTNQVYPLQAASRAAGECGVQLLCSTSGAARHDRRRHTAHSLA